MSRIILGKCGRENVSIDLTTLLRTRLLAQANSGGGKSYLLRRLAEQLFGKVQTIIIDREGEFASLREKYDFLHIGHGGDAAADLRSASIMAEKLLELNASAVIDLYDAFRKRPLDRLAYVGDFLGALVDAPKKLWRNLVIITDEAHQFCPQENPKMATMTERAIIAKCKSAMIDVATVGRKRGYCAIWVTQRLAKLDKDASAELMNRLIGATFEDVDVDRSTDLMSVSREDKPAFKKSLKDLEPGNFYGFGRAISKTRILIKIGPVMTTHPEPGFSKRSAKTPPAPAKIRALLPKLKDLPKAAEEKARTEKELRAEVLTLRTQLTRRPTAAPAVTPAVKPTIETRVETKIKELPVISKKEYKRIHKILCWMEKISGKLSKVSELESEIRSIEKSLGGKLSNAVEAAEKLRKEPIPTSTSLRAVEVGKFRPASTQVPPLRPAYQGKPPTPARAAVAGNGRVSEPQGSILGALLVFEALGHQVVPKTWLAAYVGVSFKSSGYEKNLGTLRVNGYLDYGQNKTATITDAGRKIAPAVDVPRSPAALLEKCLSVVSDPQGEILQVAFKAFPSAMHRQDVADQVRVSVKSSGFEKNVGTLRVAGMIEYVKGGIRCSDWIYEAK